MDRGAWWVENPRDRGAWWAAVYGVAQSHWDSLGKNTGVGRHFLLQCVKGKSESEVAQLQLESRPSSTAPNPVEFGAAPPNCTVSLTSQRHPEKLP